MTRPFLLAESTWPTIRDNKYEVAVLPWGATEAHNYHLPYGTDTAESDAVAARSAAIAWEKGARVLVLPTVPFGVQTGQADIPFCLNLNPGTQTRILSDLLVSLEAHSVRKLVILNGHGGNDFRQIIRELQPQTRVFLCQLNWYAALDARKFFDEPGDHGGELETSLMLHVAPSLDGSVRTPKVQAFREGWAWAPRRWTKVSKDTGVGDPARATADKGSLYAAALAERIAGFLVELSAMDPEEPYN
jgi:creatinine amidohydrolase